MDEHFEKPLKILSRRHDVIAIHLQDRREQSIPNVGLVELMDQETGKTSLVDTSSRSFRETFARNAHSRQEELNKLFKSLNVDKIDIAAEGSYVEPLMKFFKIREKRI